MEAQVGRLPYPKKKNNFSNEFMPSSIVEYNCVALIHKSPTVAL